MKVLIVNFSDIEGGAARAANRLHKSLLGENINSQMFVLIKKSDDYTIISASQTKSEKFLNKVQTVLNNFPLRKYKSSISFSASFSPSFNIVKKINNLNPDIVHLHWINGGMLKIEDLSKINAPIVWSLHDMWPFTGGCHYANNCEGYKTSCGYCPILSSNINKDLSKKIFLRKQKGFAGIKNFTIIGLSKWIESCASQSNLFRHQNIINLPNPINTKTFKPINKEFAREIWGFPKDKKLILFGAMSSSSDKRKGFLVLTDALCHLKISDVEFLVFGSSKPKESQGFGFKTHYLGQLNDDISLATLYNTADVTIAPSLEENLSNVIMESLSCGTPVVAFNIGGNSDMIDHKKNGYLAAPYSASDLANGINWVINNDDFNNLSKNARNKVLENFDSKLVVKKYIELYSKHIKN